MAKYKYQYRCPDCGTQLELKMRVTQTKRKCPHCGVPITPEEIDRQAEEIDRQAAEMLRQGMMVCLGCLGLIVVLAMCGCLLSALGVK